MKKAITTAIALLGFAAGAAFAQTAQEPPQQQPTPPPAAGTQSAEVSDADVEKFAAIYVDVEETRDELSQEMSEAGDEQQAQEVQSRMRDEIVSTIEDHGWTLARYNEIATAISNDPQLREKTIALIEQTGG